MFLIRTRIGASRGLYSISCLLLHQLFRSFLVVLLVSVMSIRVVCSQIATAIALVTLSVGIGTFFSQWLSLASRRGARRNFLRGRLKF